MNVLLLGATGFIGSAVALELRRRNHRVIGLTRRHGDSDSVACICDEWRHGDLLELTDAAAWLPLLKQVDMIINAAGMLAADEPTLTAVHGSAPAALFQAASRTGVRRIIQIAALGEAATWSHFHRSKNIANQALAALDAALDVDWVIVQPSLVFGPGGKSAQLFMALASAPVMLVPGHGRYNIQPIHIHDLVDALGNLIDSPTRLRRRMPLVGPEPVEFAHFLQHLRRGMRLRAAMRLHIPEWLIDIAAGIRMPGRASLLTVETWRLLKAGNTADSGATAALLGRRPLSYANFVADDPMGYGRRAKLTWLLAVLRNAVAWMWIMTGIVSLTVYPLRDSYELLARTGLTGAAATTALYGAAGLDIAMGLLVWVLPRRRLLWLAQMLLIGAYTLIITLALPEYWAHPYGPVLKNIPLLAAILILYELE